MELKILYDNKPWKVSGEVLGFHAWLKRRRYFLILARARWSKTNARDTAKCLFAEINKSCDSNSERQIRDGIREVLRTA